MVRKNFHTWLCVRVVCGLEFQILHAQLSEEEVEHTDEVAQREVVVGHHALNLLHPIPAKHTRVTRKPLSTTRHSPYVVSKPGLQITIPDGILLSASRRAPRCGRLGRSKNI